MNGKICKNCGAHKMLYRRSCCGFWKTRMHYCALHCSPAGAENSCENRHKKKAGYDLSEERFLQLERDIAYLVAYFGES